MPSDILRHEYVSVKSGHTWRLDIAHAHNPGDSDLSAAVVGTLNGGVVKAIKEVGWEDKDKVPYGLPGAGGATIVFKLSLLTDELLDWLYNGIKSVECDIYTGDETHTVTFETGTNFQLSCKPSGGAAFTTVANWVQDATQVVIPDVKADELTINVVDALHHSLKALTFAGESADDVYSAGLIDADWDKAYTETYDVNWHTCIVDWVWLGAGKWFYVAHIPPGDEDVNDAASVYWSVPMQEAAISWSDYVQAILRKVMRRDIDVDISTALVDALKNFYKQSYTTDALVGSTLAVGVIRFMMFATNNNDFASTTSRDFSLHDVLAKAYDNLWDFIADVPLSRFKRWSAHSRGFSGSEVMSIKHFDPFGHPESALDVTTLLQNAVPKMREDAVTRVEVSTEFGIGNDYTNEVTKTPSGRNNKGMEVPLTFDSSPVLDEFVLAKSLAGVSYFTSINDFVSHRLRNTEPATDGTVDVQGTDVGAIGNPRIMGLYYNDSPTDGGAGDAFVGDVPIRCHAWQTFVVDGETPVPPVSTEVVLSTSPGSVGGEALATVSQQVEGSLVQLSKKIYKEFYGRNTITIECDVPLDFGAVLDLVGSDSHWQCFTQVLRSYTVDTSVLLPRFTELPTSFEVVSVRADLSTEKMKIILWGK